MEKDSAVKVVWLDLQDIDKKERGARAIGCALSKDKRTQQERFESWMDQIDR